MSHLRISYEVDKLCTGLTKHLNMQQRHAHMEKRVTLQIQFTSESPTTLI